MTAEEIRRALEARHPEENGEWVVLHEWYGIDSLAIRCWGGGVPPRRRIAYEIKISKSDFRRELAKPSKRLLAVALSHQYVFAMPWKLAQQCKPEIPVGLGLVGVHDDGRHASILRPRTVLARPFTDTELAHIVRHRAHPPALRNALLERYERNETIRRLRTELEEARENLLEMVLPICKPGAEVRFKYSDRAHLRIAGDLIERDGKKLIPVVNDYGQSYEEDLGKLLSLGYRVRLPETIAA